MVWIARRVGLVTCDSHSGAIAGSSVSRNNIIGQAIGLATHVAMPIYRGGRGASGLIAQPTIGSARAAI